jgi:hypothetical protein
VRLAVAGHRVLTDIEAAAALDARGGGRSPRHAAAIAVAMALMTRPGDLTAPSRQSAWDEFNRDELIEITLDTMKWNAQKASVALGVDVEVRPGELTDLVFDVDGNWVRPR